MPNACYDIAIVGAGPAGLAAALALRAEGGRVAVVAPAFDAARTAADTRTIALLGPSVDLFVNLGVWAGIEPAGCPVEAIRLIDDRGGLLRAPEVTFHAREIDRAAFGWNVPAGPLVTALDAAARVGGIDVIATSGVTHLDAAADRIMIETTEGGRIGARLAVGADGRNSIVRTAAGIVSKVRDYPQTAITAQFTHARPHGHISTELHRAAGPLTTVPLRDAADGAPRSGLVWVEQPGIAATLLAHGDRAFAAALEMRLGGLLGRIGSVGPRAAFALSSLKADAMVAPRVALLGEAAHALPPIGAQGLNLSLRDVGHLAQLCGAELSAGRDPGSAAVLARYAAARAGDVAARAFGVHWLNQALLIDAAPMQAARGIGLHLLANSRTLRRAAMRAGLASTGALPRLMQAR